MSNHAIRLVMNSASAPDPQAMRIAKAFLARIAEQYPVSRAWLYGSRARGGARADSDVDIAILLSGPKGRAAEVGPDMVSAGYDVALEHDVFISPYPIWQEDWRDPDGHSNPWLIRNIQREGVAL